MSRYALRALTATFLALVLGFAFSQTVIGTALQELTRYYSAAARLIANAISGVNKVEAAAIPQSDRNEVRNELRKISLEISTLRASQAPLVFDLSEYINKVRGGTLHGERLENEWRSILFSVNRVKQIVKTTLDVVETSRWLKVTLDEEDRLALREVLLTRGVVLRKLESLPPPSTVDEIDQLDQANKFYRQLIKSLGELNAALTRATDRLNLE